MAKEKRFRSGLFGYNKQDVYNFIDQLASEMEQQIKIKDEEIERLIQENKKLESQVKDLTAKLEEIEKGRQHIADAIIKAEQQAKKILDNAMLEAEKEKQKLQEQINMEKDRLIEVKNELRNLRLEAINVIREYETQLYQLAGEGDNVQETEEEAAFAQEFADSNEAEEA